MEITERHRHRFEFNNKYRDIFEHKGMIFSGMYTDAGLVEMIELPSHPWFLGTQAHPEFKSRPTRPAPLYSAFIEACIAYALVGYQQNTFCRVSRDQLCQLFRCACLEQDVGRRLEGKSFHLTSLLI